MEPEPIETGQDRLNGFRRRALAIGILDPQKKPPSGVTRVEPVEQGSPRAADVQIAGGRRRKAQDGRRIFCHHRFRERPVPGHTVTRPTVGVASSKPVPVGIAPSPSRVPAPEFRLPYFDVAAKCRGAPAAFGRALMEERERWVLWLPVAFGAGIGIYFALPAEPSRAIAMASAGLSAAFILIGFATRNSVLRACCMGFALLLLGFDAAKLRTELVRAPILMHRVGPLEI